MEILHAIWNVITAENKLLCGIINIPFIFIESVLTMLLFIKLLNISALRKQKLIYIILFAVATNISNFLIPSPYNTFINFIICIFMVFFIFKLSILKSIIATISPYVILLIISPILVTLYAELFSINADQITFVPLYKFLYAITLYSFVYLIYKLLVRFNINISLINIFKKNNNIRLLIIFLFGAIALCIQGYLVNVYSSYIPLSIILISIAASIIYFFISMYSLIRTSRLEITTENLEEERLYNKTLTILYDNIRGFKHDFNNIVQAIGGYIATDNMHGLKEYYSDLMSDCKNVNNLSVLNPELLNNPAIYSILTSKYHKSKELGITMNFDIFIDLKTLNIKTYDLTRILGILLDNAIEAASLSSEKEIYVTIRKDNKANRQLFIIENTYANKDVNTDRIFEKGYTSKNEPNNRNHGLGLWEVREILRKNNNLNLFTTKSNKLFSQQLEIYF